MAKTTDITNKLYGTGTGENNVTPVTSGKINFPAKLTTLDPNNEYALLDAFNIDWASAQYSYDGDPEHIIQSTGHLIEIINSKATTSGDIWDDIKDSAYITQQINIYASYTTSKSAPSIDWRNQIDTNYDNITSYSSLPSSSTTDAQGWYTSVDEIPGNNLYVFMSSVYKVLSLANETLAFHGPTSTPIYLPSESAINGNFKSTVFVRANKTPDKPVNGAYYSSGLPSTNDSLCTYNNGTSFIPNKKWTDDIPAGKEMLWATTAVISDDNGDWDQTAKWSEPRQMTDTATYDVEFAKKQTNDARPPKPTDSNSHGSDAQIWFDPTKDASQDFTQMYWRAERECINGEWGDWVIVRIKGEQGTAGIKGDFKSTVFTRTNKNISSLDISDVETDGYNNYNNPIPPAQQYDGETIVWSDGIPNGTGPVWSSWKTFTALNNNGEWSTPQLVADTPTYDVEFSPNDTKPAVPSNDKTQREAQGWYDPNTTTQVNWEAMIWRAERNRTTSQDPWSAWVITKIKGEDGKVNASLPYHEQRWAYFDTTITPVAPDNNAYTVGNDDNATWKLTFQYESGKYTWMTTRPVIYDIEDNVQTAKYVTGSTWSTPIRITPKDGINGEANPIQPVLKYTWYNHYDDGENYPAYLASEANPNQTAQGKTNVEWHESPGNPSGDNKYLWMIQGERFNGNMRLWDTDGDPNTNEAYWTSPVCLSGKDGEPGADGDDIEFIYKRFSSAHDFTNDNPSSWYTTGSIDKPIEEWIGEGDNHIYSYVNDYLGPDGSGWQDNPQGVDSSYKYEYATYRKTHKINGESYWEAFNTPFAWSIYGENGIDGDGVEYIYYTYSSNVDPVPPIFDLDPNSFQKSEVYGEVEVDSNSYIWHDDPQTLNNDDQKFQWVSTRKYRAITSSNINKLPNTYTLDGGILKYNGNDTAYKAGDKIWFPYSDPELWNWYTENGTDAARIVMIYRRNDSGTTAPQLPTAISGSYSIGVGTNSSQTGWAESPGNSGGDSTAYLWMTSAHYTNKVDVETGNKITAHKYELEDLWQTPVCLTGEPGHDGEDGTDIEFIYFRTGNDNKTFNNDWDNFAGDSTKADWPFVGTQGTSYYIIDGVKTLLNQDHDTWSDNPLGVTSTYDYEYASIRKKIDGTWQDFCKPFLWSKYGEDGVDGDGVEYIYYLSPDENTVKFNQGNLPPAFNLDPSSFQKPEVLGNNWSDDPTGISEDRRWEYVSVRKFREITDSNLTDIPESYREQVNVGDKIWFPYSEPAVWSHFAVDALATSLVFETDNDMIAVSVDDNSHVTKNATSTARMYLYHDTKLVSTSYYNVNILDSNLDEHNGEIKGYYDDGNVSYSYLKYNDDIIAKVSLSNNTYVMEYNIPQGFDMSSVDDELRITTSAYIFDNSFDSTGHVEVGSERPFVNKVKGLHVDLSDIYQIQTDKNVVKKDAYNELENVTITLKSLTSNSRIDTTLDAVNIHLFILYKNGFKNTSGDSNISGVVEIGSPITLNADLSVHEFELWYNPSNKFLNNDNTLKIPSVKSHVFNGADDILLDKESLSLVWDGTDGKPGTDSKSQEYIYYRSELPVSTWNNAHNPSVWSTHENVVVDETSYYAYCTDDFPFIAERTSYNNWYDHPQGIDGESYLYEYVSTREYDTSTKEWGTFSEPVAWATWGHTGEDGDGVEYIYYRTSNEYSSWVENEHPANWFKRTGEYQSSEYIHSNATSIWKDNPQGVTSSNKYEYISIRKYKKLSYKDWNNFALTCKTIGSGMTLASNLNRANTNIPVTFTSDEQLYNLRDTIITLLNQNVLYGDTWQLNCGAGSLEILNAVISSITNNEKYWSPYSQPTLWAKYGEKGATGDPGGSGLTFDFDNPSIQIAVNSNGKIKDYQEVTTYLNVYEGASKIPAKDITLSIISNGTHVAFEHSYSDTDKYGYTLFNSNSSNNGTSTYYTWKIGDVDTENIGDNNIAQLTENSSIEFNINYKGNDYIKRVSLVPIQYGKDGANAVVFDLYCPTSVIHYNAMDDTPSFNPKTISDIKVRKIENSNVEYKITEGNNINKNGFAISYYAILPLADSQGTGGNTGSSEEGTIGRKTSPQSVNNIFGYTYDGILDINDKINTALNDSKLYDIPKTVKLSLYHTENDTASLWDETDLEIIYDGINGTDSFAEEFIYSITYIPNETSGGQNPHDWDPNDSRDYIPNNQTNNQTIYWKDHPQGVSPEHPIEWMSHRTYNYDTKTWNRYEAPVKWSHWGENGKDGDGVEYIYTVGNNSDWKTALNIGNKVNNDPRRWFWKDEVISNSTFNQAFQTTSEYIRNSGTATTSNLWSDDPITNLPINSYQFVSTRKYKKLTSDYIENLTGEILGFVNETHLQDIKDNLTNTYLNKYIWLPYSEPTIWSSNIPGQPGQKGADAVVLDWTNDQINLAVDENGKIYNGVAQYKSTTLKLLNSGDLTIDNLNCYNYNRNYFEISLTTGEEDSPVNDTKININSSYSENDKDFTINISIGEDFNGNITIPENGLEVTFTVTLSDHTTISKVLKICGQHIPSNGIDGQNAVTYEIVPSTNAINYTTQGNIAISYVVNKYDGNTITQLSSEDFNKSPLYLNASWIPSIGSISYNNTFNGVYYLSGGGSIDLKLWKGQQNSSDAVLLDTETIPVLKNGENGESGTQGFTGPIVRMRGEYNSSNYYSDGAIRTGQSTSSNNYSETDGPRYVDIVIYTNNNVTKYYKCNGHTGWSNGTTQEGITKNTGYCNNRPPTSTLYWTVATQYDFIATKLLYADQALINQISTHDLIATNQDGYPVAGVTSGSKMYDKNNTEIVSYLSTLGTVNYSENAASSQNDPSNVRIFAGQIWNNNNSYSLTYAPFNVRQDGTAYMSKANIVGDVNIGGNVNISGDNVNMSGHLSANTLSLGRKSFYYNENVDLPAFSTDQHKVIYAMFYSTETFEIIPKSDSYLWLVRDDSENNGFYSTSHAGDSIQITDKALYTLYSGCGNNPVVSGNPTQKFWIITKNNLFVTHVETSGVTDYVPASISIDITDCIEINSVEFKKVGSSGNAWNSQVAFVTFGFLKNQNVMPESETREYKINNVPTSFTFGKKESVNITLNLSENWTLVSQVDIHQWGNVSQWGDTLLWNDDNINNLTNHNKYKYVSKIPQNATDNIEGYPSFYIDRGTIEPEGGMCLEFYRNGTSNSNDFGANEFKNDLHIVSASLRLSRSN